MILTTKRDDSHIILPQALKSARKRQLDIVISIDWLSLLPERRTAHTKSPQSLFRHLGLVVVSFPQLMLVQFA